MLRLTNIIKEYPTGNEKVAALRGVSLEFRKNEFVAILGPSGCGKTTLLNIIGGLDQYTDGDLAINGISTKRYKDADWDAYRNHSVGFVFQSYNLIPHQTVLANVELALSISGVSKRERRARAVEALKKVGLGDQLKKKPNQMSGGQMQRVAIARALVNDPEILLADEPTGALDSETSVQVMELLKEIAKDRLVVMVTHNPELADEYATRIVRLLDGKIIADSDPYTAPEAEEPKQVKKRKVKKPSMSFFTALGLSWKNLLTKKGRTILTAFAGSIGIIGIALIFAVSNGTKAYIDAVQEDTLSSYPLTLESTTVDLQTLMQTFMGVADTSEYAHDNDKVYSQAVLFEMINAWNNLETLENDLKKFKSFVDRELAKDPDKGEESALRDALSGVQYTYDFDLQVYTKNVDGTIIHSDTTKLLSDAFREFFNVDMNAMMGMTSNTGGLTSMMSSMSPMSQNNLWCEMLSAKDGGLISPVIYGQYDLVYGSWPNEATEVVLVLDKNNELDDMTLYALGLIPKEEVDNIFHAVLDRDELNVVQKSWSYKEICNRTYRVVLGSDCYQKSADGTYTDWREVDLEEVYNKGFDLRVVGIIRPNEDAAAAMLTGSIAYTKALTEYIVERNKDSNLIAAQKADPTTDVISGLPFKNASGKLTDAEKETEFRNYIKNLTDNTKKANTYIAIKSVITQEYLDTVLGQIDENTPREEIIKVMTEAIVQQMGLSKEDAEGYLNGLEDAKLMEMYRQVVVASASSRYAASVQKAFNGVTKNFMVQVATMTVMQLQQLDMTAAATFVAGLSDVELASYYLQAAASGMVAPPEGSVTDTEFLTDLLNAELEIYTTEQCATYYDEALAFSESTYEQVLSALGYVDLDDPSKINLYSATFEAKDTVEAVIAEYNASMDNLSQIRYTDLVGLLMSSITTIIDAITYVLIAFVSISLVVSAIMIAVITLISVQERTKEIGILRAIGASKRNVSNMFNAETMIIGLSSGLLGVCVTWLLCIPINAIVHALTEIETLSAVLTWQFAAILVCISVVLTLIAGIIPSRSAAKKDPVVALRTE